MWSFFQISWPLPLDSSINFLKKNIVSANLALFADYLAEGLFGNNLSIPLEQEFF